mgnify:CR=1 FL=1
MSSIHDMRSLNRIDFHAILNNSCTLEVIFPNDFKFSCVPIIRDITRIVPNTEGWPTVA